MKVLRYPFFRRHKKKTNKPPLKKRLDNAGEIIKRIFDLALWIVGAIGFLITAIRHLFY